MKRRKTGKAESPPKKFGTLYEAVTYFEAAYYEGAPVVSVQVFDWLCILLEIQTRIEDAK